MEPSTTNANSATPHRLAELERAVAQLRVLNCLAQMISSTLEVETILQNILQETLKLTLADQGSILSFDEADERPVHTLYKTADDTLGCQLSGVSDLIGGWVFKHRSPLKIDEFSKDSRFENVRDWFPQLKSVLAVPMIVRDRVTGIIILLKPTPFTEDDLELMSIIASQCGQFLENAKQYQQVYQENIQLRGEVQRRFDFHGLIGRSAKMQRVFELLRRVAAGETRILIVGESGTGKELIARTIHYNGPRKDKNFVAVDCGALPESLLESELFGHVKGAFTGAIRDKKGLFEVAHQGTLFLDEISNTSLVFQSKLLRAIQEGEIKPVGATVARKVDGRIIAATSQNLKDKVTAGEFREDLYYRLNVITINLPSLRERPEDIRLLAEHFLKQFCEKANKRCQRFSTEVLRLLEGFAWPGNIRELENVVERAVALAAPEDTLITPDLLPQHVVGYSTEATEAMEQSQGKLNQAINNLERNLIAKTLEKHDGNRTETAKSLGITRPTLLAKIKKHHL